MIRLKENEEKKEFLNKYLDACKKVERIQSEIDEIKLLKMYPSSNTDGMPHGNDKGDLSDYIVKISEKEEKLEKFKNVKQIYFLEIMNQIDLIENDTENAVLFYKYIKGMSWEEIADTLGYSVRQIYRYHGSGLLNLELPKMSVNVSKCQ